MNKIVGLIICLNIVGIFILEIIIKLYIYLDRSLKTKIDINRIIKFIGDDYFVIEHSKYSYYDIARRICIVQIKDNYTMHDTIVVLHEYGHFLHFHYMSSFKNKFILFNKKSVFNDFGT